VRIRLEISFIYGAGFDLIIGGGIWGFLAAFIGVI